MKATGLQLEEMIAAMSLVAAGADADKLVCDAPPELQSVVDQTPNSLLTHQLQSAEPEQAPARATASNAAAAAALAAPGERLACPPQLADSDPLPRGWLEYGDKSDVFHCGFRTILEKRHPTPSNPINECVYDHAGQLVDEHHPYAGCRGTPDQYYSGDGIWAKFMHGVFDTGGPRYWGKSAYKESRRYFADERKRKQQ